MKKIFTSLLCMALAAPAFADEAAKTQQLIVYAKNNGAGKPTLFQQDEAIISLSVLRATATECVDYTIDTVIDGTSVKAEGYSCAPLAGSTPFASEVCTGEYVRIGRNSMLPKGTSVYFDHCDEDGSFDSYDIKGTDPVDLAKAHTALVEFVHTQLFQ